MGNKDILKVLSKSDEKRRSCVVHKPLSHTYIQTGPLQYPFGFLKSQGIKTKMTEFDCLQQVLTDKNISHNTSGLSEVRSSSHGYDVLCKKSIPFKNRSDIQYNIDLVTSQGTAEKMSLNRCFTKSMASI